MTGPSVGMDRNGVYIGVMSNEQLLKHYHEKHGSTSRRELTRENPALYRALISRQLGGALPKTRKRKWSDMTDEQLVKYYYDNYEGAGRTQLLNKDPAFYKILRKQNLLTIIPSKLRIWKNKSDNELVNYYHDHYEGLTATGLKHRDAVFYNVLRKRHLNVYARKKKLEKYDR